MRTSIAGDFHIPYQDTELVRKWFEHIQKTKPDRVILNGDLIDATDISLKFKSVPNEEVAFEDELEGAREFLRTLRHYTDGEIVLITGNHEFRLRSYINTLSPKLVRIGACKTLDELLELDRVEVDYIDVPDNFATFQDNYFENQDFLVGHFNMARTGLAATSKGLMEKYGKNILQSHVHRLSMIAKWQYEGQLIGVEGGCMCNLNNNYRRNANWQNGWVDLIDNEVELHAII